MSETRIRTAYYGPTDSRGARIIARGMGRQLTVPYDHAARDMHRAAADRVAAILGLEVTEQIGSNYRGRVFATRPRPAVTTYAAPWDDAKAREYRAMARNVMADHGHAWRFRDADERDMTRDSCGACVLAGWNESTEDGPLAPNYGGWARIYVEAGRPIPSKYRDGFDAERRSSSVHYAAALERSIATFGVTFA